MKRFSLLAASALALASFEASGQAEGLDEDGPGRLAHPGLGGRQDRVHEGAETDVLEHLVQ